MNDQILHTLRISCGSVFLVMLAGFTSSAVAQGCGGCSEWWEVDQFVHTFPPMGTEEVVCENDHPFCEAVHLEGTRGSQHSPCGFAAAAIRDIREATVARDGDALRSALVRHSEYVTFVLERDAVQVTNCNGDAVLAHFKVGWVTVDDS